MSNPVSIVQIGDLIQTKNDKSKQLQSGEYLQYGVLPIVDQGAKHICGYTNDLSKCYDKGLPVVVFGDHTLHTKFIDFNFAIGADGTQVLGPKSKECDTKYLYYLVSRAAELIGSEGYKRHFKILKEFDIEYIEPLPKQQKIATILSSVDDVIEKTRAQIDKLKDLKTGMMQELLTKGIGHTEFKDSPVGRIPADWNVVELGSLKLDISDGNYSAKYPKATDFISHGAPFIRANNMKKGALVWNDMRYISHAQHADLKKGHLKENDILITTRGEIGNLAIVTQPFVGANINAQLVRINTKGVINFKYFYYYLQKRQVKEQIYGLETGTALRQLPVGNLKKLLILLPSPSEQEVIAETLSSVQKKSDTLDLKLKGFLSIKKALMQDLLTGKVRVKLTDKESAVV